MQHYQRLKDLREDMDLKQKDVYDALNMQKTTYTNYEQGKREIPFEVAIQIADFYQVSLDYLSGKTNDKKGLSKNTLKEEEIEILDSFKQLSEKQKGEIEYHLKLLLEQNGLESGVG